MIFEPQVARIDLKGCQGTAKGRPSDPEVDPRRPKVATRMAKGEPLEEKVVPKVTPGKHFRGKNFFKTFRPVLRQINLFLRQINLFLRHLDLFLRQITLFLRN